MASALADRAEGRLGKEDVSGSSGEEIVKGVGIRLLGNAGSFLALQAR